MFMLPGRPSPQAEIHELADFLEFQSWTNLTTSKREVQALLGRIDDNEDNIGVNDDDDRSADQLDEALNEIDRRAKICGASYPFTLDSAGNVLRYLADNQSAGASLYKYLLLSTRLNMKSNRSHAAIDGTLILEEWGAHVLKNYLGGTKARSYVFGTSNQGKTFPEKVNHLHSQINEGGQFANIDPVPTDANDGKLDVVAWLPFSDRLPGQVVIFAQCKTGTNWKDKVHELQPTNFIKKWMAGRSFIVNPLRAFIISESVNRSNWSSICVDAGILFDRCRLTDCLGDVDASLLQRTNQWVAAAKTSVTPVLPSPGAAPPIARS